MKTLKELKKIYEGEIEREGEMTYNHPLILEEDLRQAAIALYKNEDKLYDLIVEEEYYADRGGKGIKINGVETLRNLIKYFFNITEEELK